MGSARTLGRTAQTSQRTVRSGLVSAVSFDRAADYYDATRALPDDVREAIAELLVAELPTGDDVWRSGSGAVVCLSRCTLDEWS
jgi:hypothetical protein